MRKIIFIVTQSEFGGAQRYIFEMVSNLDKQKYDILVAAGKGDGELFKKLQDTPARTIQLKWLRRTPCPLKALFSISEIYNLLKREKPNTLFLCSTTAGLLGSLASKIYKFTKPYTLNPKPYVIYRIGGWSFLDPRPSWMNKILFWLEKSTALFKDKIIVNSEKDKKIAIEHKICPPEKIVKIHNGINSEKLKFFSKEEAKEILLGTNTKYPKPEPSARYGAGNIQDTKYLIGTVANFYKTKGLEYLIKSAHILNTRYKILNTKYIVIGDGKERKNLEELIKKYNLEEKVILLGRILNAYQYLKAFDIFVLPSLKEGFPWVILEAMAAEIPVIATRVGSLSEIIEDEKEGILVKSKNSHVLAEKIFWLLNHKKEAKNMGFEVGQKVKKEFSLKRMVSETEKILV